MAQIDISGLSKSDQEAVLKATETGDWSGVSEAGLRVILDDPYDTSDVIARGVERGITNTIRGVTGLFNDEQGVADFEAERELRAMLTLNPVAGWSSYLAGSVFDPANTIPIPAFSTVPRAVAGFAAFGGLTGAIDPLYEEFDDSRTSNILTSAATAGVLGGGITALVNKVAGKTGKSLQEELVGQAQANLNAATVTPGAVKPRITIQPTVRDVPDDGGLNAGVSVEAAGLTPSGAGLPTFTLPKLPRELAGAKPAYRDKGAVNFESDLDKAFYIIGKTGSRSAADSKYLDFVMKNTGLSESAARAEGRKITAVLGDKLKNVNVAAEVKIPTIWTPTSNRIPRPTTNPYKQTVINVQQSAKIPKIADNLFEEKVVHNNSELVFESDIDKAATAVYKNSRNKQDHLNYIKNTFGINDKEAQEISNNIGSEIVNKVNRQTVIDGKLAERTPLTTSETLDNILNPVTKHMDDESRYLYDYSKFITAEDGKPRFKIDDGFRQFYSKMKNIFGDDMSIDEAVETVQGYQKLMDNLKKVEGKKFTVTNIRDFYKNRENNLDAYSAALKMGETDLNKFKRFLPERITPSLTADQIRQLSDLPDEEAAKLLGAMADRVDDDVADFIVNAARGRIKDVSRITEPMSTTETVARTQAQSIAQQFGKDTGASELAKSQAARAADHIAANYQKDDILSPGARQLVRQEWVNRYDDFVSTLEQLDFAEREGNDATVAYLWTKLQPSLGLLFSFIGDANAVSRTMNDFKRYKKFMKEGKAITRLFENGEC